MSISSGDSVVMKSVCICVFVSNVFISFCCKKAASLIVKERCSDKVIMSPHAHGNTCEILMA